VSKQHLLRPEKKALCTAGHKGRCNPSRPDGRRCAECEYDFQQTQTQQRRGSPYMKASLAQMARQVEAMETSDQLFYRRKED
jgi:transposase-like protein